MEETWGTNGNNISYNEGNVGIGTTAPSNKLDVNGTIRAKEIIVEAANFPDCVFDDGYVLPTLAGLESYIAEYGRLPGLPSAETVQEEGLSVGESQRLLLEKSEELVLYTLEQQREIETLKAQNRELRSELCTLKEMVGRIVNSQAEGAEL